MLVYLKCAFILCLSLGFKFSYSSEWYNGNADVTVISGNIGNIPKDGMIRDVHTSLESALGLTVTEARWIKWQSPCLESPTVEFSISFLAYLKSDLSVSACLPNKTFQHRESLNVTYEFASVTLQNFDNTSVLEKQCQAKGFGMIYIIYNEEGCEFSELEYEGTELSRARRYNIYKSGSVLRSFYCSDFSVTYHQGNCNLKNGQGWVRLSWNQPGQLEVVSFTGQPFYTPLERNGAARRELQISELLLPWGCSTITGTRAGGPPITHLYGDQTWMKLPAWLRKCLKILNGLAILTTFSGVLTYSVFRDLRNPHGKNVLSLLSAVLASLLFTSGFIPLKTDNEKVCIFIGLLRYYVVLVPNYWWMAVTIFLARSLGRRGIHQRQTSSGNRFFLLLSLLGWGVPFLFTMLALFLQTVNVRVFATADSQCWIDRGWPSYLLTAEMLAPFVVECTLFVLVLHRLRQSRKELKDLSTDEVNVRKYEKKLIVKVMLRKEHIRSAPLVFQPL